MSDSTLILPQHIHDQIFDYVDLIDAEIGMFGYVTMTDDVDFVVDEVFLVEQEVTGSTVDFMDSGLAFAIEKAAKDDRLEDLLFSCHSHVNMGVFWSQTDEDMIEGMNNGMTPYLVSLVVNKKRETKQRVDFFNPGGPLGKFTKQATYDLDFQVDREVPKEREEEVKRLVKRRPIQTGWTPVAPRTLPAREPVVKTGWSDEWDEPINSAQMNWWDNDDIWDALGEDDQAWARFESGDEPILNAAGDIVGWRDMKNGHEEVLVEVATERGAL